MSGNVLLSASALPSTYALLPGISASRLPFSLPVNCGLEFA
jgi:hypothetical protein